MTDAENRANPDAAINECDAVKDRPVTSESEPATGRVVLVPVPPVELLRYAADLEAVCLILLGAVGGIALAYVLTVLFRRS